jgi:hypothetical protein
MKNVAIISFGRSGSSWFIDMLSKLTSDYDVISEEITPDNYLNLINPDHNNKYVCKFVFKGDYTEDVVVISYLKKLNFEFIFIDRNAIESYISNIQAIKKCCFSNNSTGNCDVVLELNELKKYLDYKNMYMKKLNESHIYYTNILYEDLIHCNTDKLSYINDTFSKVHNNNKIYFSGTLNTTFVKQNNNKSNLCNVSQVTNVYGIVNDNKKTEFSCSNKCIQKYYEDNVKFKISYTKQLRVNIVNFTSFLKMEIVFDMFYDHTKNYICVNDNKIILILTYDLNNSYEIVNDPTIFMNYTNYDMNKNISQILTKYSDNVLNLKHNRNCVINDIDDSFIIHLDDNLDRLQNIIHFNYTKNTYLVNAITYKNDIIINEFCNYLIYRNFYVKELYEQNKFNSYTRGAICLTLSNLIILQYCVKHKINKLIIFEDDFVPHKDLSDINKYLCNKPSQSDLIYLSVKQDFRKKLEDYNDFFYKRNIYSWGTLTYCMFNAGTIMSVFKCYCSFKTCIDCYTFDDLNCYVSTKNFFIEDTAYESNIRSIQNSTEQQHDWGYKIAEYDYSSKKTNFVMFNYTFVETTDTWKSFANNIYLQSNSNYSINYNDINVPDNHVIFFDFVDREFGWDQYKLSNKYPDGFPFSWGGIIHHPFKLNSCWGNNIQVSEYLNTTYIKKCLKNCKFLIVLSDALKNEIIHSNILQGFNIKIHVIYHIMPQFNMNISITNTKKNLLFLGWSFRNYSLFYKIDSPQLKKIILPGTRDEEQRIRLKKIIDIQTKFIKKKDDICVYDYVSNSEFLSILSDSVVFLDFDGVSANNSVLECIKFNIPLIVRKCAATVFYLGDKYPMFYETETNINSILHKLDYYITKSIIYLNMLNKTKFSMTTNVVSVVNIINSCVASSELSIDKSVSFV